jgi:putative redox protein
MGNTHVELVEGMQFVASGESGHAVIMDSDPNVGGNNTAARPVEVLLCALGGCTGMDVISILRKMRTVPKQFSVEIEDERASEHPKVLTRIHFVYRLTGDIPEANAKKAIELSMQRYCPITNMVNKTADVTWEYQITKD